MAGILLVDSNDEFADLLKNIVQELGHDFDWVRTLLEGQTRVHSDSFDLVFLNTQMVDGAGIDALSMIVAAPSNPEVIVIADQGDATEAEKAIRAGAWDYQERPHSKAALKLQIVRAMQYRAKKTPTHPSAAMKREFFFNGVIGKGPQMKACFELMVQAAMGEAGVLVTGETGTGKEIFAEAIHRNSSRKDKNFVVVDCAALPETLVESTLFGHVKGAYTGAESTREGLVKQADQGTLFLDEIGELPLGVQTSFLRILETKKFRQVGGKDEEASDFRVIAATNQNLEALVKQGKFRSDLLFRIRSVEIVLPPLRDRIEDIEELCLFQMDSLCQSYDIEPKRFSSDFFNALSAYDWPGNVRELINALERAIVASREEPVLFPRHLPTNIRVQMARDSVDGAEGSKGRPPRPTAPLSTLSATREAAVANIEKSYLTELMALTSSDIRQACGISGLSRSRLYALLKKYDIPR